MSEGIHDAGIAPSALFSFVATTLADVARRIERIEAHAADMLATLPRDADRMVVLQDLDAIRQTVEDVARVALAAGPGGRRESASLVTELRLAELRERLLKGLPDGKGGGDTAERPAAGRVELFQIDAKSRGQAKPAAASSAQDPAAGAPGSVARLAPSASDRRVPPG
jgi:hypothetical protein